MAGYFDAETLEKTIQFHGHKCPGLAIGIRAAELAANEVGEKDPADFVAVTETDMCGVDAIQFLTGATFGKGNLIHRDFGKAAFSFYGRNNKKAVRAVFQDKAQKDTRERLFALMEKIKQGKASDDELQQLEKTRETLYDEIMGADLFDLFVVKKLEEPPPRKARVLDSIPCESCGENTMESRTRRFAGKTLCIPCFEKVEQKI